MYKLYTYQCDRFYDDDEKNWLTKEYATECADHIRRDVGKSYYYCMPTFLSYESAENTAQMEAGYWYFIIEMEATTEEFEDFINDDHDESCLRLLAVSDPVMSIWE